MRTALIILLTCCFFNTKAQQLGEGTIVALHPALGQTITLDEKSEFCLFQAVPDTNFECARLVQYNDSIFSFIIYTKYAPQKEHFISKDSILKIYSVVEKVKPAAGFNPKIVAPINDSEPFNIDLLNESYSYFSPAPNPLTADLNYHHSRSNGWLDLVCSVIDAFLR